MSILLECEPGDAVFCLQEFDASPDGQGFSWDTARHFRVGEKLRYVSFREDANYKGRPTSWLAILEARDGSRYAATQTYFVTEEGWSGLKKHFARKRRPGTAVKKARRLPSATPKKKPVTSGSKKRRSA